MNTILILKSYINKSKIMNTQLKIKKSIIIKPIIFIYLLFCVMFLTSCFPLFRHSRNEGRRSHRDKQEHHEEHRDDNHDRH